MKLLGVWNGTKCLLPDRSTRVNYMHLKGHTHVVSPYFLTIHRTFTKVYEGIKRYTHCTKRHVLEPYMRKKGSSYTTE